AAWARHAPPFHSGPAARATPRRGPGMRGTAPRLDPVREEPRLPFAVGAYDRRVEQDARAVFLVAEDERLRERVVLGRFGAPQLGQLRILVSQPGQAGRWAQVRHPVGQPIEAVRRVEEGPVVR